MPDNKRQHYVPKSTLRHFACDAAKRQINIINIKRRKIIRGASLRDQCYRDYFYGKATHIEKGLSQLEGLFVAIVRRMVAENALRSEDAMNVVLMISLQRARTLRAEEEVNAIVDKLAKLTMIGRFDEQTLRKVRVTMTEAAHFNVGLSLSLSPIMFDLKQFLIVNNSAVPFVISDNPVVATNWFGRARYPNRALTGLAQSGLQMIMPISPRHALLLHDAKVYMTDALDGVIQLKGDAAIESLNELQWQNAHRNVYFPPGLDQEMLNKMLDIHRGDEDLIAFRRLEGVGKANLFRATDKDEFAAPSEGVTQEVVQFGFKALPKDIHLKGISMRPNPRFFDNGSMASPVRDPAWGRIVHDFADALEAGKTSFASLGAFVAKHPLVSEVGPWVHRVF
jgi:hypothetical protein